MQKIKIRPVLRPLPGIIAVVFLAGMMSGCSHTYSKFSTPRLQFYDKINDAALRETGTIYLL
ncbi:MAG: hypothetical protein WAN36_13315, partial [Calditrichia bacterium]